MAAASAVTASSHCPRGTPTPSSSSTPTQSTIISPSQPRWASIPSISDVISGAQSAQSAHQQLSSGQASPFATRARQYPESDKNSTQPSPFPVKQEGSSDSPLPPFSGRPRFPSALNSRLQLDPHSPHISQELPGSVNGYFSATEPSSHLSRHGQLIARQMPHPGYTISPREHYHNPVHDPLEYADGIQAASNRHFETWSYQESLSQLGSHARAVLNFVEAYLRIPERLPTEREVGEMLAGADTMWQCLEQFRNVIQTSIRPECARERSKMMPPYENSHNHDVPMNGDRMKTYSVVTEVKRPGGRVARSGRCHKCNRTDTPEWRRGPGGVRTLCNACGLQYAKMERKRQLVPVQHLESTQPRRTQSHPEMA